MNMQTADRRSQTEVRPLTGGRQSPTSTTSGAAAARLRAGVRGMTLVELMVAMGLFAFVSVGLLYTHLFCLQQDQLVNSKLGASDQSRRGFDQLTRDIRSAKQWEVGTHAATSTTNFTQIALGSNQRGNALRLSYTADPTWTNAIIYYFDTSNMADDGGKLVRQKIATNTGDEIARFLTNRTDGSLLFQAQDYKGVNQTNRTHKGVIRVLIEFAQYQYPLTKVGNGCLYDYYKMEFKLSSHVPDGP